MHYNFDEIIDRNNTDCLKFDDKINRFGSNDLQPLWVADMDFKVANEITQAFHTIIEHGIYGYNIKTDKYYNSIINWFQSRHNYTFEKKDVVFTPGVVPAISYIIQAFTNKGDKIIVQPPVYYPFFWVVKQNERQILYNQLIEKNNYYTIDFDLLEKQAKEAKILILSSPHNPAGRVWTKQELERIADISLRNNLLIISDEIHNDLVFHPHTHIPIATLSTEIDKITITCHAPSKTFNLAGLSTAYIISKNLKILKQFQKYYSNLHTDSLNPFGLIGMEIAYTKCNDWHNGLMEYLKGNYTFLQNFLSNHITGVKASPLEATYLAWLDFRSLGLSDSELKNFIIYQAKLGLNDGPTFGPGGSGFQRINLATPKINIQQALLKLQHAINSLKGK